MANMIACNQPGRLPKSLNMLTNMGIKANIVTGKVMAWAAL